MPPREGSGRRKISHANAKAGSAKQDERRTPRQRRDVAGDGEADTRACELSREDVSINAAALGSGKVIAHEGSDHGAGCGRDRAEGDTRHEQSAEARNRGAQIIAMPQRRSRAPSIQVRRTRSAERRTAGL